MLCVENYLQTPGKLLEKLEYSIAAEKQLSFLEFSSFLHFVRYTLKSTEFSENKWEKRNKLKMELSML